MRAPTFPPLFSRLGVEGQTDPFAKACAEAARGCDAGLVVHNLQANALQAALVFAPDVVLADAIAMLPLCGCGTLRAAASTSDPQVQPDWLVIGLDLPLWPASDDTGHTPDQTALYAEGCAEVDAIDLLEAWVRHTLVGINTWTDSGAAPLHKEWRGLAYGIGEDTTHNDISGTFVGIDEHFGMLLRDAETTHLIPLTDVLED